MAKSSKYFIKLDLIILSVLQDQDRYAYEITKYIKEQSHGVIVPKQGTMYPIIYQLLEDECITSHSELYNNKARVYYHLEDKGKEYLKKGIEEYDTLVRSVDLFLHGEEHYER